MTRTAHRITSDDLTVEEACVQVTHTRASHWPANAACPCSAGTTCSGYLNDDGRTCRTYVCRRCKLRFPYCFGAADYHAPLCDSCTAAVKGTPEEHDPRWTVALVLGV